MKKWLSTILTASLMLGLLSVPALAEPLDPSLENGAPSGASVVTVDGESAGAEMPGDGLAGTGAETPDVSTGTGSEIPGGTLTGTGTLEGDNNTAEDSALEDLEDLAEGSGGLITDITLEDLDEAISGGLLGEEEELLEADDAALLTEEEAFQTTSRSLEELLEAYPDAQVPAGIYNISTAVPSFNIWGIPGGGTADLAVKMERYNGSMSQKFVITPKGNGRYSIVNYASGRSLDIANQAETAGVTVKQHRRNQTAAQEFYLRVSGDSIICLTSYVPLCIAPDPLAYGQEVKTQAVRENENGLDEAQMISLIIAGAESLKGGSYMLHAADDEGYVVTVAGASKDTKAAVRLEGTVSGAHQKFVVYDVIGGTMLAATSSHLALDVAGGTMAEGTKLQQYTPNNTPAQKWQVVANDDGTYSLRSVKDNRYYLTRQNRQTGAASDLCIAGKLSGEAERYQKFSFERLDADRTLPDGVFTISAAANESLVLDVDSASRENRANVRIHKSNNSNAQKFRLAYQGNGYYTVANVNSEKVLDVAGGSSANRTNIQQYKPNGSAAQKWRFVKDGSRYRIESGLGKMMDVADGRIANNSNLQIYKNNGSEAQAFTLAPTKPLPVKRKLVAIDAGHQAHANSGKEPNGPGSSVMKQKVTSGTYGKWSGLNEYVLNLQVSLQLQAELQRRGYDVYMVRSTHNVDLSNAQRAQMATAAGADIFIRIHANSSSNSSVRGVMMYQPSGSNRYLSQSVIAGSQRLASLLIQHQCAATGMPNKGILTGDDMTGINWATMPVTIVEMGFMSNPTDDIYMASAAGQAAIVQGLANGVDAYYK
ncbi:MAG: RICIN domain-containing protein [Lachnospiraceae bacterium]|nr:RICIN domain-containing protein [Lachnospiraceae bacterium]